MRAGRFLTGLMLLCAAMTSAFAEDPPRKAFRVCSDPNNMPFSNTKGEGVENKLAELFAKSMGLPLESYYLAQRMNFVRNTLRYKLPGSDYPCDIIMGVPVGFDQVSVTKPYYRSTYALVFPKGKGLDGIKTGQDFIAYASTAGRKLKIGLYDRSPASEWVAKYGLTDMAIPYKIMSADPEQYSGEIIDKDLANGKIDVAVVWGPIAGYFAEHVKSTPLTVVPLKSEQHVKFDFEIAMGVRYGEKEWKDQIEKLIESNRPEITAILKGFGIPLLDANGELIQ